MQTQLDCDPRREREVPGAHSARSVAYVGTSLPLSQLRVGDRPSDTLSYRLNRHTEEPDRDSPFLGTARGLTLLEIQHTRKACYLIEPGVYSPPDRSGIYATAVYNIP